MNQEATSREHLHCLQIRVKKERVRFERKGHVNHMIVYSL